MPQPHVQRLQTSKCSKCVSDSERACNSRLRKVSLSNQSVCFFNKLDPLINQLCCLMSLWLRGRSAIYTLSHTRMPDESGFEAFRTWTMMPFTVAGKAKGNNLKNSSVCDYGVDKCRCCKTSNSAGFEKELSGVTLSAHSSVLSCVSTSSCSSDGRHAWLHMRFLKQRWCMQSLYGFTFVSRASSYKNTFDVVKWSFYEER